MCIDNIEEILLESYNIWEWHTPVCNVLYTEAINSKTVLAHYGVRSSLNDAIHDQFVDIVYSDNNMVILFSLSSMYLIIKGTNQYFCYSRKKFK